MTRQEIMKDLREIRYYYSRKKSKDRKGARPFQETRKNTFPIFRPAFPRFWIRRAHRPF